MLKKLLRSSDLGENYAVERIAVEACALAQSPKARWPRSRGAV